MLLTSDQFGLLRLDDQLPVFVDAYRLNNGVKRWHERKSTSTAMSSSKAFKNTFNTKSDYDVVLYNHLYFHTKHHCLWL